MIMNLQHWANRENLKKRKRNIEKIIKQILINIIQLYEVGFPFRPSLMNEKVDIKKLSKYIFNKILISFIKK